MTSIDHWRGGGLIRCDANDLDDLDDGAFKQSKGVIKDDNDLGDDWDQIVSEIHALTLILIIDRPFPAPMITPCSILSPKPDNCH